MKYNNNKVIEDVIEQLASRLSDTFDAFNHKFLKICIERYAYFDLLNKNMRESFLVDQSLT